MRIPNFENENEIAAFMEEHDGFELLDEGFAEIVETSAFKRKQEGNSTMLKSKKINIYCKDDTVFRKVYPRQLEHSVITFVVLEVDSNGILICPDSSNYDEKLFIPFINISGIKVLQEYSK